MSEDLNPLDDYLEEQADLSEIALDALNPPDETVPPNGVRPANAPGRTAATSGTEHVREIYEELEAKLLRVSPSSELRIMLATFRKALSEHDKDSHTKVRDGRIEFPRIWSIFAFVMPRKIRDEVFEPAEEELKEDFLIESLKHPKPLERRILRWMFSFRMMRICLQSFWAWFGDKLRRFFCCVGLMTIIQYFIGLF